MNEQCITTPSYHLFTMNIYMGPEQKHLCMLKRALELDGSLISNIIGVEKLSTWYLLNAEVKLVAQFSISNSAHTQKFCSNPHSQRAESSGIPFNACLAEKDASLRSLQSHHQTWNLSKILHRQIFRLKILHRQFHLILTALVRKNTKNE